MGAFILMAAGTGARRSELIVLRWSDLDLARGTSWIARGIVVGRDGLVQKDTKTHAARKVSLDPTCVEAMRAHDERAVERAHVCEHELSPKAFVFTYENDGMIAVVPRLREPRLHAALP